MSQVAYPRGRPPGSRGPKPVPTKLCYRCGKRFSTIDGAGDHSRGNSAFSRHEPECLQRAIEADARRRSPLQDRPA